MTSSASSESWRGKVGQLDREELDTFLGEGRIARLACLDDGGWPYVVPCWQEWDGEGFWVIPRKKSAWAGYLRQEPRCAITVDEDGTVTAQNTGKATITALVSNGQALRCSVTVASDIGKVTLNKNDLILREAGEQETLTAAVAVETSRNVPITWISSNPGVATVDTNGVVTAVADGEAKITALSPEGKFDTCVVMVGMAADKYNTEEDLADELKLPNPYIAIRLNRWN